MRLQKNKITPELLAKYRVYVKIKPVFLDNLRRTTPKKMIILKKKLMGIVWEVKTINNDENAFSTNGILLDGLDDLVGYKCSIFADEVKIVKVERMGGKLF